MGILLFTALTVDLFYQKSRVEDELVNITNYLTDVQAYSSFVGSGSFSAQDLTGVPGSMMGRAIQYMNYAHNTAMAYANQNGPTLEAMYSQQMQGNQTPEQQQKMHNYVIRTLYMQKREEISKREASRLHVLETKVGARKNKKQTQYDEITKLIDTYQKMRDKSIDDMIPKFGNNG
ncbi:hypothetical protein IJ579_05250 [bacterium]|nr:hypothetical protein [bacterium]